MTPSMHQANSDSAELPEWREAIRDEIGEDPGRWLDRDLVEYGPDKTDRTNKRAVHARIKGIRSRDVIDAWQTVEVRLERDGCPRQQIMAWLNRQDARLKQRDSNPRRRVVVSDSPDDEDEPMRVHDDCGSVVQERDGPGWRCPDCETVTRSVSTVEGDDG